LKGASVHSFPRGVLWRRSWWYSAMKYVAFYRDEFANFMVDYVYRTIHQ
jgi:hypothetical protein